MNMPPIVSPQEWTSAREAAAGQGEGADPRPRCAGRRAPPDAEDGRREGLPLRGPGRTGEPARPVRRAPSADRLPLLLRARRGRLARAGLPRLLHDGRPGRPPRASERPRHHARVRLARAPAGHRALEGAHGLGQVPWYTLTDDFDADFGVDEWHGTNVFFRDGDEIFRTYFVDGRGDEALGSTFSYLDITALGRQEDWEDSPEGYPQTTRPRVVAAPGRVRRGRQEDTGSSAVTTVPAPGGLVTSRSPFSASRRSLSPRSPEPASASAPPTPSSAISIATPVSLCQTRRDAAVALRVLADVREGLAGDEVQRELDGTGQRVRDVAGHRRRQRRA